VIEGFELMDRFWHETCRARSLRSAVQDLRGAVSRHIFRPTILYRNLLERSLEPKILEATRSRARLFRSNLDDGLCSARIVKSETEQLVHGDIPIFHGRPAYARRPLTPAQVSCAVAALAGPSHS
jgi:lantibiotic modifying enzyme